MALGAKPNFLYKNNGDGSFAKITAGEIVTDARYSRGANWVDYDSDGDVDMFVTNERNQANNLYRNMLKETGVATFTKIVTGTIVTDVASSWSASWGDYYNDGDPDIYKANGALKHLYGQEDQLFENIDGTKFIDVSLERGDYFHQEYVGRGACLGDYDNDGDMDILVVNLNDRARFLRNNKGNMNNWILLHLTGTASNRDAIGARIKISSGGKEQIAQKKGTTGYLSQNEPRVHFGLGKNEMIEKIEIKWPSGKMQTLENVKANQVLEITEP